MLTAEQLTQYVRDALNSLYAPEELAHSPLLEILSVQGEIAAPLALRHLLVDAIKRLKPSDDCPVDSLSWRTYEVLSQRYMQQLTQREVADQMGLSTRHVRREQEAAIEVLAMRLWDQYCAPIEGSGSDADDGPRGAGGAMPSLDSALAWLGDESQWQSTAILPIAEAILPLIRPLAARQEAEVRTALADDAPEVAAHPMALRQMLLNLVCVAIRSAKKGVVSLSVGVEGWDAILTVDVVSRRPGPNRIRAEDAADLEIVGRLARMSGGRLDRVGEGGTYRLVLPLAAQVPILVIDDSGDNLRLLSRYVTGTRYRIIESQHPEQALELIEAHAPRAIVLDVIMPNVDGWELLQSLASRPATKGIPIVLCTVLSQRDLALALGARELLTKPISRTAFLGTLDKLLGVQGSGSA